MTNNDAFNSNTPSDAVSETLDLAYEVLGTIEEELGMFFWEMESEDGEVAAVAAINSILDRNLARAMNPERLLTIGRELVSFADDAQSRKWFADVGFKWLDKHSEADGANLYEWLNPLCTDVDGEEPAMGRGSQTEAAGEVESILIKFSGPESEPILAI